MYRCGVYIRTSKNVVDETNSLIMQEGIIDKYIEENDELQKVNIYIDDGYSGLDFIRPAWERLMKDIDEGVIDCLIVKDLSRLGRDYIQTGIYIQYILPDKGVRLIAINDRYDSAVAREVDKYFMIPLRNYINDSYSRDISIKVRSSLYMKMKKGECVVSKVPYGYIKKDNKLIVNENLRGHIINIYNYCLEGYSLQGIADILNKSGVVTPYEYRNMYDKSYATSFLKKDNIEDKKYVWYPMMVKRILTDKIYIGVLVQGKVRRYSYKIKKRQYIDKNDWYYAYGHHEKIIDEKKFYVVNNILRMDVRRKKNQEVYCVYSGVIKCEKCGKGLYHKGDKYKCNTCKGKCYGSLDITTKNLGIYESVLDNIVKNIVSILAVDYSNDSKDNNIISRKKLVNIVKNIYVGDEGIRVEMYYE